MKKINISSYALLISCSLYLPQAALSRNVDDVNNILFKGHACDVSNNIVYVFYNKSVSAWEDKVAKELLLKGAKYGENTCHDMRDTFLLDQGIQVYLFPTTDTNPKFNEYLAKASILPTNNYEIRDYTNRGLNYHNEKISKQEQKRALLKDGVVIKIMACGRSVSSINVYIDESIEVWKEDIAKDLLTRGAIYGDLNCPHSRKGFLKKHGVNVYILSKSDLKNKKSKKYLASASIKTAYNNEIKNYRNNSAKKHEKEIREREVKIGEAIYKNVACKRTVNNNHIYVDEKIDISNHKHIKSLLLQGIEHGKGVCKTKRKVTSSLFPNTHRGKKNIKPWAYMTYKEDRQIEYTNKEAKRRAQQRAYEAKQQAQQRADKMRRDQLARFVEEKDVEKYVSTDKLVANPYIYEDQIVLMKAHFSSMLSKSEALFAGSKSIFGGQLANLILVTKVPTTRFTKEKELLLVGKVIGKERYEMPSGNNILITHVKFIDAYEQKYKEQDLKWVSKKLIDN